MTKSLLQPSQLHLSMPQNKNQNYSLTFQRICCEAKYLHSCRKFPPCKVVRKKVLNCNSFLLEFLEKYFALGAIFFLSVISIERIVSALSNCS